MNIETLEDWNNKLEQCGCCFMPECPEPVVICENSYAAIDVASNGFGSGGGEGFDPFVDPLYYRRVIYHYEGPAIDGEGITGSLDFTETSELDKSFITTTCYGGDVDSPSIDTTSAGGGSHYFGGTFDFDCDGDTVSMLQ
jgi:hypothetical protein